MNFVESLYGSPSTIETYTCLFNKHIAPYLSEEQAKIFKDEDMMSILNKWRKLHPRSKKVVIHLLEEYVRFCGGSFNFRKARKAISQSVPISKPKALNRDELAKLLVASEEENEEFHAIISVTAHTGMRKGEIFGLEARDIDLERNIISVQRSYDNLYTKNRSPRILAIHPNIQNLLKKRKLHCRRQSEKLFRSHDPNPRLAGVCKKAGIPVISLHALRHTFATLALDSNKSLKKVQSALGHKSLKTTLDIYWNNVGELLEVDFL